MLDKKDRQIAAQLQKDIDLAKRPFAESAKRAGVSEEEFLKTARNLIKKGVIRKFGAILRHQKAGFTRNAMVVWAVPEERCEAAGKIMASFSEVSHCYQREPAFEGKYNLFTMIHMKDDLAGRMIIEGISRTTGIEDYQILVSEQEYKKTSMEYF